MTLAYTRGPPLIGLHGQPPTSRYSHAFAVNSGPSRWFESLIFHTSHLSTAETLPTLGVGAFGFGCFWGVCVCCLSFRVASPTNMQSFHPFYDDLGTPPTWRPYSWKKQGSSCKYSRHGPHAARCSSKNGISSNCSALVGKTESLQLRAVRKGGP